MNGEIVNTLILHEILNKLNTIKVGSLAKESNQQPAAKHNHYKIGNF